jgi:hypothetical protein
VEFGVLTATTGTWVHATSYSYSWHSCAPGQITIGSCRFISGATGPRLIVPSSAFGRVIRVNVNAVGPYGSQGMYSEPSPVVGYGPPINEQKPWIEGEAFVGERLTAHEGTWNSGSAPRHNVTYLWQRCDEAATACQDVKGPGSETTYLINGADRGSAIRVVATLATAGGSTAAASLPETVLEEEREVKQARCHVPRLIGKRVSVARKLLARGRCKLGRVKRMHSTRKIGLIVRQRPKPGTRLRVGGKVTVFVSKGRRR